jgi:hypothetical protein
MAHTAKDTLELWGIILKMVLSALFYIAIAAGLLWGLVALIKWFWLHS